VGYNVALTLDHTAHLGSESSTVNAAMSLLAAPQNVKQEQAEDVSSAAAAC
jgi:hypothetical protein